MGLNVQFTTVVLILATAMAARGQGQPPVDHQHHAMEATAETWTWMTDANVFYGYNYQQRLFADFSAWESQNWFMGMGQRRIGAGTLTVNGMLSLEPLTIAPLGSPQLYQTGESYQGVPLVNHQHPHDLIMGAGVRYRIERPRIAYAIEADLVGSPALGPTVYMHRESARNNPQTPLIHHSLDATHITTGVLTGGVELGAIAIEASAFRGAEPDENRLNIEQPRLDSWSTRLGWHSGSWQAQVSGGHLHEPEWYEPYDVARLTASVGFSGALASRPLNATLAWGRNLEDNGFNDRSDSYLLEWDLRATGMNTTYGRIERATKQVFGLAPHPKGLNHQHNYSRIGAFTFGYLRDLTDDRWGRFGVGADATFYRTSADMVPFFDSSHSYHFFVRWRPTRSPMPHVH